MEMWNIGANTHDYDAIVIGGGFAGLSTAQQLGKHGHRVLLLEARERLGGRTWYRPFAGTDQLVEMGGQWIATAWQPHVAGLIARYGLAVAEGLTPVSVASLVAGQRLTSILPVPMTEIFAFERLIYELIHAARRLNGETPLQEPAPDLDIPFTAFLAPLALPPATYDYAMAWVAGAFGCDPSGVSTVAVLAWIADYEYSVLALHLGENQTFAQGTMSAVAALCADLRAEVRLGSPVRSVMQDAQQVVVTTEGGQRFTAATAVVAVPINVLGQIEFQPALNDAKQAAAREGHAGHAVKVWALVQGAREPFHGCGKGPGLTWLATQRLLPEGSLMVGFGPGPGVVDMHSLHDVQRNVRAFVPGAQVLAIDAHDWSADPYARGAWIAWRPGQLTRFGARLRQREGRLAFAGSDIATSWAGWIEGALSSAIEASAHVLQVLESYAT